MAENSIARQTAHLAFVRIVDGLAIAVAIALPWSTSAAGILIACWVVALPLVLDWSDLRRVIGTPAGGLPVLLWGLGVLGTLWADVPWSERLEGVASFYRLLVIPLLLSRYRCSGNGWQIATGYIASCMALLGLSVATTLWPSIWRPDNPGVPVHDQTAQSAEFVMCAFGLAYFALASLRKRRLGRATGLLALAAVCLIDVIFVATSRTELVVVAVLMVLAGFKWWGARGTALAAVAALGFLAWNTSPYLRGRIEHGVWEFQKYEAENRPTSIGLRLGWWGASIKLTAEAPLLGHGTGSIRSLYHDFDRVSSTAPTTNPHNQTITIALQLGLVGAALLLAMWFSHAALFRGGEPAEWIGSVIVVQNVVGSLFNSHLFDFVEGWTYVWGVGVVGRLVLRARSFAQLLPKQVEARSEPENLLPAQGQSAG
jgi:O-antigen ligase